MDITVNSEREMKIKAIKNYMSEYFAQLKFEEKMDDDAVNYSDIEHIAESVLREIEQIEINFEFGE